MSNKPPTDTMWTLGRIATPAEISSGSSLVLGHRRQHFTIAGVTFDAREILKEALRNITDPSAFTHEVTISQLVPRDFENTPLRIESVRKLC